MGGRGASSGLKSSKQLGGGGGVDKPFEVPKVTQKQLKGMDRKSLETLATAIFANQALKQGVPISEGVRRARLLMDGNTSAQIRKYIQKNNK